MSAAAANGCGFWASDEELRRDLWRAENPGLSLARGVMIAMPISLSMWAGIIAGFMVILP